MRIVGGEFRGRILSSFQIDGIRPTADNVRENLFNILSLKTEGCSFLDLFCGTGAVGIEAISRGARAVTFNDISLDSVKLTKKNLQSLNVPNNIFEVTNFDGISFLQNCKKKYDVVFIDAPYKLGVEENVVNLSLGVLNDGGIIILENEKPFLFDTPSLIKYDERKYGRVYLTFFKKAIPENKSCLFAGTFDPITKGHVFLINECKKRYKTVYVAIGVNADKTPMFSLAERLDFIKKSVGGDNVIIDSYDGFTVDYIKKNKIDVFVRGIRDDKDKRYEKKAESFNKELYPSLKTEYIIAKENNAKFSSTKVRNLINENKDFKEYVSEEVYFSIKEKLNIKDNK